MTKNLLALLLVPATLVLAGCSTTKESADALAGYFEYKETGRTIHLKMHVEDLLSTTIYPSEGGNGLQANLWAFCVEPDDPNDAVSAAAIEGWTPLPTDSPKLNASLRPVCSVPAPTIHVRQGDRVIVEFSNNHVHPHTIHWHGQYVLGDNCPDTGCSDGAQGVSQQAVQTGEHFTYDFIAKRAGTLWYHCHVDPQLHVMEGLYGMMIVDPQDTSHEPEHVDVDAKLILGTMKRSIVEAIPGVSPHGHPPGCFVSGRPDCQNPPIDVTPDVFTLNGHSYPFTEEQNETLVKVHEGDTVRMRILNAGTTVEAIHLHGHDMLVTHKDGVPLLSPYYADTVLVGPAERYDVVVKANNPGAWLLHTHVEPHETNDEQFPGGMHTMFVYAGFEHAMHAFPAEKPGGFGYNAPLPIAADFSRTLDVHVGTDRAAHVDWGFPVEMPCAVKTVQFSATLGGGSLASALSNLTVTVTQPAAGTQPAKVVATFLLGRQGTQTTTTSTGAWSTNGTNPNQDLVTFQGTYKVAIDGTAVEADVHLSAAVDYFASYDEIKDLHKKTGRPLCGTYGEGTSGIAVDAPNP